MDLTDIVRFQLIRENPFEGLVIDAETWKIAHKYHRDHQRLHALAFHGKGVVAGLQVTANTPPDLSVTIQPGLAIDPEGNVIVVAKPQRQTLQTRDKGTVYLIIQFREIPGSPYQPPDGGQPTRIQEAYRIQERAKPPDEPHLELARIEFDPAEQAVKDAKNPSKPGKNEIDLRFRQEAMALQAEIAAAPARETALPKAAPPPEPAPIEPPQVEKPVPARETITIGHMVVGDAGKDLHLEGLRNLAREISIGHEFRVEFAGTVSSEKEISRCNILYMTGNAGFELSEKQQTSLGNFLKSGGAIFAEGCSEGQAETRSRGAKEFGLAFNQLASKLGVKLESVQRGHPLLAAAHIFSGAPEGAESGVVLEGGSMVYSASDYGCAWQGGRSDSPLPRDVIRSAVEMGSNIITHFRNK